MKRTIGLLPIVFLAFGQALFAQPQFRNAGAVLVTETITNKVIESGELVTVSLALKNVGNQTASNLVATIQGEDDEDDDDGIEDPVPRSQNYGRLAPGAPSVAREFAFTTDAPSSSLLLVNLHLQDSGRSLGVVPFRFRIGPQIFSAANSNWVTLNDRTNAAPYPSVLSVSNVPGGIIGVTVTLSNLWHTFPDDLDILLTGPSGDAVMLMSDVCGGTDISGVTLIFSDHAEQALPDNGVVNSPHVRPTNHGGGAPDLFPLPAPLGPYAGTMSAFNGKSANGQWKLYIMDDATDDDGFLADGWSLTITTLQPMDAIPTVTLLPRTNLNTIRFAVSGRPDNAYAVETSPDAVQSFPFETFIMPSNGIRQFELPVSPANRFFRAATDP